jgi:hypothetical protein
MSIKLDAIAYRGDRIEYRLRRLEKLMLIVDAVSRDAHVIVPERRKYWDMLDEIRTEIYNREQFARTTGEENA